MTPAQILLVEDDDDIREAVQDALERRGYRTSAAEDGQAALDSLRAMAIKPQLILLDLTMPRMSGWQFMEEKAKDATIADIPVVVLSAVANVDRQQPVQGWAGVLAKPVSLSVLIETVAQFCKIES